MRGNCARSRARERMAAITPQNFGAQAQNLSASVAAPQVATRGSSR